MRQFEGNISKVTNVSFFWNFTWTNLWWRQTRCKLALVQLSLREPSNTDLMLWFLLLVMQGFRTPDILYKSARTRFVYISALYIVYSRNRSNTHTWSWCVVVVDGQLSSNWKKSRRKVELVAVIFWRLDERTTARYHSAERRLRARTRRELRASSSLTKAKVNIPTSLQREQDRKWASRSKTNHIKDTKTAKKKKTLQQRKSDLFYLTCDSNLHPSSLLIVGLIVCM